MKFASAVVSLIDTTKFTAIANKRTVFRRAVNCNSSSKNTRKYHGLPKLLSVTVYWTRKETNLGGDFYYLTQCVTVNRHFEQAKHFN